MPHKKRILYLYSDTGGGHRSAASAIINAIDALKGKQAFEQEMVDVFAQCSTFLNVFAKLYAPVIKYSPKMWGAMYYWLNDWSKLEKLEKMARPFIQEELTRLIRKFSPSAIVSVHPMINHLTVEAIKNLPRRVPFITVVTDPISIHRAWIDPRVDAVVVASRAAREEAIKHGMPVGKIKLMGMPVDPKFLSRAKTKEKVRGNLGLNPKLFTLLVMGGGEGAGKMYYIIEALCQLSIPLQIIAVAGRNAQLKEKLDLFSRKSKVPLMVLGFTHEVPRLMSASDAIVTKAGPGAIFEALAKRLPIIITSWLPGQEEGNVEFVVKEQIGWVASTPEEVSKAVLRLLDPHVSKRLEKHISRARKPRAVFEIARLILSYIK